MIIFRDTHFLKRYHEKRIKNQQINGYDINNKDIERRYGLKARVLANLIFGKFGAKKDSFVLR